MPTNIIHKKLVVEMFHDWYVLDHILFNGDPKKYLNESAQKKYSSLKKIYLQSLMEFYEHIGYKSRFAVLPKNSKQLITEAKDYFKKMLKESARKLKDNSTKYTKLISEGLTENNSSLIDNRISQLKTSILFDKCFMENSQRYAIKKSNIKDIKGILINNCLTEARKELIQLSIKYFK